MVPTIYNQERLASDHRQQLLHEAEHERKLAVLPQQHMSLLRLIVGKLGDLLMMLGLSLKRFEHRTEVV
jgi:hypothetical protein